MKGLTDEQVMLLKGYMHKLRTLAVKLYELTQESSPNYQESLSRADDYRLETSKYVVRMNHIASSKEVALKGLSGGELDD